MSISPLAAAPPAAMPWLKSYPAEVSWHIDIPRRPLFAFLEQTAGRFGPREAVTFAGHSYSWAALQDLVARAAQGLQGLGLRKGVKAGLFMPNSAAAVVMYYAILRAGGTVVNYNPAYIEADLAKQVEDSETDILVTLDAPPLLEKAESLLAKTRLRHLVVCPARENLAAPPQHPPRARVTGFAALVDNAGAPAPVSVDFERDIAVLQYTGGTTGVPKGAALTHQNVVANALQIGTWYHNIVDGEDSMVAVLPLFHVFAMTVVMNMAVIRGLKLFIMPHFDIKEMLALIHAQKPSYLAGVPTMYAALAAHDRIRDYDFSSLKFCLSGGAPLPGEIKKAFEERTGARLVTEGYGLTEFSPVATCNPVSRKARSGSVGLPIPGTTVEIISLEDGVTPLKTGERGEICVSGPQMMQGYYKRPAETAEVIRRGRLHTGDIGTMDEDGFVYIVDRLKDLILVGGYNVYPRHVEEAIYKHPAVKECIVAGIPDKLRGEAVAAWVVPREGQTLAADALRGFLADKLSPLEVPRKIIIRDQPLPKTAVGKLSRKDLLAEEGILRRS